MKRFLIIIGTFLISGIGLFFYEMSWKENEHSEVIHDIISALFFGSVGFLIDFVINNWSSLRLSLRCLIRGNEEVYVSLSYLFKIKVDGINKYLMVKSNKIPNQYQPVGGVYKRFASSESNMIKWSASEAKNDEKNIDDLRFNTKRKHIPSIRKWFFQGINREVDVWREFCEELILIGILPKEKFEFIKPEFLYSMEEHLIFRKGKNIKQFLIYNIFTIDLSKKQKKAIKDLLNENELTDEYAFVDEDDLNKEIFINNNKEYQLGYHARYLKNK